MSDQCWARVIGELKFPKSYTSRGCQQRRVKGIYWITWRRARIYENRSYCMRRTPSLPYWALYSWIRRANFGLDMINLAFAWRAGGSLRISFWFISCLKIWHETLQFIHTDYVFLGSRYSLTILGARFSASRWGNLREKMKYSMTVASFVIPQRTRPENE